MQLVLDVGKKYPEITGQFSDAFSDEIERILTNPQITDLVLDMQGTERIGSRALGSVFSVYKNLKAANKTLKIINPSLKIVKIIRLLNMGEMLPANNAAAPSTDVSTISLPGAASPGPL